MTLKNTALALALASLTLWGCGGDDKDTAVAATGTAGTGTATGGGGGGGGGGGADSGGGGGAPSFVPDNIGVFFAEFAYNADDGEIVPFSVDGTDYDSHIVIYAADSSQACIVDVSFPTPFAADMESDWAVTHGLFGAFVIPDDAVIDSSDCDSQITDPDWVAIMAAAFGSPVGIGLGDLTGESADLAAGRTYWGVEQDYAMGGGWFWADLSSGYTWAPDGYLDTGVSFGFEVDDDFMIMTDDDGIFVRKLPADAVGADGQLSTGFYVVEPFSSIIFG